MSPTACCSWHLLCTAALCLGPIWAVRQTAHGSHPDLQQQSPGMAKDGVCFCFFISLHAGTQCVGLIRTDNNLLEQKEMYCACVVPYVVLMFLVSRAGLRRVGPFSSGNKCLEWQKVNFELPM
eukprot:550555-Pelagomonas_calceolata.AAC.1